MEHIIYKTCSRCKAAMHVELFRIKYDKRDGRSYYNNICLDCEKVKAKEYYLNIKDDSIYKSKNQERAKNYHWNNRDKVLLYQKKRRESSVYKEYRKRYYYTNRERILTLHRVIANRAAATISDYYILGKLGIKKTTAYLSKIDLSPLIEAKRLQIKILRTIKTNTHGSKNN